MIQLSEDGNGPTAGTEAIGGYSKISETKSEEMNKVVVNRKMLYTIRQYQSETILTFC